MTKTGQEGSDAETVIKLNEQTPLQQGKLIGRQRGKRPQRRGGFQETQTGWSCR